MIAKTWGAVAFTVVALCVPAVAVADTTPVISAHRSTISGLAENSLAAFEAAAEAGVTDLEGDTFVTADGVLVMSHDSPLPAARCAGPYLGVPLRQLTATQVAEMTCGGEPVARLDAVIAAVKPFAGVTLRIEIKHPSTDTAQQRRDDAVALAQLLSRTRMTTRSLQQDFSWAVTTGAVHAASPGQRVSALSSTISSSVARNARAVGAYEYSFVAGRSTRFWNSYLAARGLRSAVWSVDDTVRARALRAEGVGTIITDIPLALSTALADPASGCTVTRFARTTALKSGYVLEGSARLYAKVPRTAPDGRVVETTLVKVTAKTATGTSTLRFGPQGTPYTTTWEKSLGVTTGSRSTTVEVAAGDADDIRVRNLTTHAVTLTATVVGGSVYTCP